jgi:hypothetical protein
VFYKEQNKRRTAKDAVGKKRPGRSSKLKIAAAPDTFKARRSSASKQKGKVGVTERGDQQTLAICKSQLCPDGVGFTRRGLR